jgi:pimeloyl-ACP methyl ester carboxylesterase
MTPDSMSVLFGQKCVVEIPRATGSWRRAFALPPALIALFILVGSPARAQQQMTLSEPPPTGRLIDVGGWKLHLNCTGDNQKNSPTVVLESGGGGFSFEWALVQPGVSGFTRVCSYDRAGSAWSEPGPRPRTFRQIAYELRTLLIKAGVQGPYVMVGHSTGGLLVRTFAMQYPQDVAGMVLVDSTSEDTRLVVNGKFQRVRDASTGKAIPPVQTHIADGDKKIAAAEETLFWELVKMAGGPAGNIGPYSKLPAQAQQLRAWAASRPTLEGPTPFTGEEAAALYTARQPPYEHPLGDLPLIVLTAGHIAWPHNPELRSLKQEHDREQAELAQLSAKGKQIIAKKSGHLIIMDEPKLVVAEIREVVEAAQIRVR